MTSQYLLEKALGVLIVDVLIILDMAFMMGNSERIDRLVRTFIGSIGLYIFCSASFYIAIF